MVGRLRDWIHILQGATHFILYKNCYQNIHLTLGIPIGSWDIGSIQPRNIDGGTLPLRWLANARKCVLGIPFFLA